MVTSVWKFEDLVYATMLRLVFLVQRHGSKSSTEGCKPARILMCFVRSVSARQGVVHDPPPPQVR
jgi:hypothetical protein